MLPREPVYRHGKIVSWRERGRGPSPGKRRRNRLLLVVLAAGFVALLLIRSGWVASPFRRSTAVTGLHPQVKAKGDELVARAARLGIAVVLTNGFRSAAEQDALYDQGRVTEGPIVTKAKGGQSYHNYGLAIDFALRTSQGDVVWDLERDGNGRADWMEVVKLAKRLGFEWGGDWVQFPDYPHLQMGFGYSLRQLQHGKYPPGTPTD
jgi:peptidoglycan L-alanyl-D-glutamate endopeptidase CwlK